MNLDERTNDDSGAADDKMRDAVIDHYAIRAYAFYELAVKLAMDGDTAGACAMMRVNKMLDDALRAEAKS